MSEQCMLVVDDVEMNRAMLCQLFEESYTCYEAADGLEALDRLEALPSTPVAILLDLVMPRLDGFGLLARLKADERYRNIPVILITGEESAEVEARAISMGGADLIRKPFNAIVVRTRVDNAIQLYMHRNNLEELVETQTARIRQQLNEMDLLNESIVDTLSNAAEFRDMETGQHIKQIKNFTRIMLETYRSFGGAKRCPTTRSR